MKSPFNTLILENNGKQNPDDYYTNNNQNHVGCSFDCKLKSTCI